MRRSLSLIFKGILFQFFSFYSITFSITSFFFWFFSSLVFIKSSWIKIVLPETKFDDALIISEKIRTKMEQLTIKIDDKSIKFTISIGVSQIKIEEDINIDLAIYRADLALYDAKNGGRNMVCSKL